MFFGLITNLPLSSSILFINNDQHKSVASHNCRKHYQQNDVGNLMLHGSMFECI